MSFLEHKTIKEEYKEKEDELNKLREERRLKYLNSGHKFDYRHLLFSEDTKPIPYIDTDDKDYLINGVVCWDMMSDNLKYNEFILVGENYENAYEHVKFLRERTKEEQTFMEDYNKIVSYKSIKYITEFKPNTDNYFTINIFNLLK